MMKYYDKYEKTMIDAVQNALLVLNVVYNFSDK